MKKHKFDLALGGFFLGTAATAKPYDWLNLVILGLGLLWVFAAWISLPSR